MGEWRETYRSVVLPGYCDQFGHMNVRWYAAHFDDASFHIWAVHGLGRQTMEAHGVHTVVARTTIDFVRELKVGDLLLVRSAFTRVGGKSVTFIQRMFDADSGTLHAVQETVEVFFDPETRGAVPIPDAVRAVVEANLIDAEETA